jgi:hypothetical protein
VEWAGCPAPFSSDRFNTDRKVDPAQKAVIKSQPTKSGRFIRVFSIEFVA